MSTPCNLCGADFFRREYTVHHSTYLECTGCHSWCRISQTSKELQQRDFIETYGERMAIREAGSRREKLWPALLDRMKREASGDKRNERPSLLDVGCGYGGFLLEAQRLGWSVEGIEINPTMLGSCSQAGLKVSGAPLSERTNLREGRFDVVTYFNVLDSIENPLAELQIVLGIMNPGGRVWIRVPNGSLHIRALKTVRLLTSLEKGYLDREWTPLNAWIFTPAGLKSLLHRAGFSKVHIEPSPVAHRGFLPRMLWNLGYILGLLSGGRLNGCSSLLVSGE